MEEWLLWHVGMPLVAWWEQRVRPLYMLLRDLLGF